MFCEKHVLPEEMKEKWIQKGKDKKCLIMAEKSMKPVFFNGWVISSEIPKLQIMYIKNSIHLAEADVILCPVSNELVPLGEAAGLLRKGVDHASKKNAAFQTFPENKRKQLKVGDLVPIYDTGNLNCLCLLLVVQDKSPSGDSVEPAVQQLAEGIMSALESSGYQSFALHITDGSYPGWQQVYFSLLSHMWKLSRRLRSPILVQCFDHREEVFDKLDDYLSESVQIEESLLPVTFEVLRGQVCKDAGMNVIVEEGSILEFDSKVEVIVNSVSTTLDLKNGMVSKMLMEKGGTSIQEQCKKEHKDGIDIGEIAVTNAGRLECKKVFHVALYTRWVSNGNLSIEILKTIITKCLTMAEKKKFKSIAFPALGTGTLGYPPCLVAKAMFDVIEDFGKVNPEHLKTVHIVLFGDKEVVQLFQKIDHWRKNKKPENVEFDIPPKYVTYVQNSLETRIMVSDRVYYRLLAYKELRIVATEQTDTGFKLEWDTNDGCFTTTMQTTKTEDILRDCFKSIIKLMETRRFHVVDICYSAKTLVIPLQRKLKILIQELRNHHDKKDQANKNLQGNKPPIINYIKVVRIFVTYDEYEGLVSAINEENGPPKWHITEKTAFPFNIEVVGMKANPTDLLKKIKQDVLSIKATFHFHMKIKRSEITKAKKKIDKLKKDMQISLDENSCDVSGEGTKTQISNAKKELEPFQEIEICFEMMEDDFVALIYITKNELLRGHVRKHRFDKGKAVFELNESYDVRTISDLIKNKNELIHQLSGAEVSPPHQFQDQFPMIQQQVEDMGSEIYCFLSMDKQRIIIKSGSYEQAQSAKYMVEVNLGMVQQGGGRRNRVFASSDMGPGPVANKTSVEESAVRDGKKFKTIEGIDIYVYCAGIGNLKVETLVNAANKDLQHGGGIAYHISNAAGYALEKECDDYIRNNGPIPVGSCCTSTAGKLPYKFIIHAVGPMWHSYKHDRKGECLDDLKSTILSALKMATDNGLKSIALPSISSGIFGVPNELCAQQYLEAVKTYSNHYQTSAITEIHFIDKDRAMCNLIQKTFEKELVQQGGGRRNRVIASSDMGPGPVENKTSTEESAVRDGKRFRTKEGIDIYVYCAGIGNLKVETLVNAANKDLQHGGGIAYHISNAAGYALEKECDDYIRNNGPIPVGSCCTSTAGKLPYKFIIHAVGPMWHSYKHDRNGECLDDLKSTILSALKMATDNGLKSIALPSISSGIFGVPNELCAQQYLEAVKTYSNHYQTSAITEIHFIDKDRAMCNLIQKTFEKELVQQGGGRRNRVNIQKQGSSRATYKFKINIKKSEMAKAKKKVDKFKKDMDITLDEVSQAVFVEGTKTQISDVRKELEPFQEIEICFDMTEDDFVTLMYITKDEFWRSHVRKCHFNKGKAVFELEKPDDIKTISDLIRNRNNLLHQLSGAEVCPTHQFQDQFLIIQQQVEEMGLEIYCFMSMDKKRIIIKSDSYEQAQSAKLMVEVKLGMVLQGGGRRNRVITSSNMRMVVDRKEEDRESGGLVTRQDRFPTPPYWSDMKGEFTSKIKLEEDGCGKQEWQDIQLKFHKSLPYAKIVSIQRMQNMFAWEKYWVTKKELETHNGSGYSNEMLLFHGTTADKLNAITVQNLDPRLAGSRIGALLGKGTYFAIDADYSDRYAQPDKNGHKFMFLVRVLVGKSCRGNQDYLRPPLQDPSDPNNHKLFDSCVDNEKNPKIYCVFDRTQYYLEYLIEYL